jgi:histidine ammonia-lyase
MIEIDGNHLSLNEIQRIVREFESVNISSYGTRTIQQSHEQLERIISRGKPVYGINTGFGAFSEQRIPEADASQLSRNLILSHAVGTGDSLPDEFVRAAMLIRANTLAKGYSGVRVEIIQVLLDMLESNLTPVVPSQGSLGSSGDLLPLAHTALVFTTDEHDREDESGWANFANERMTGKKAMQKAGIERIILGPKEGLAITNGATFSAGIASLVLIDLEYLLQVANAALALSLEAVKGCSDAFDPRIQLARGHHGQIQTAEQVCRLIEGSQLVDSTCRVQDAYSLRCAPHVHGAILDTLNFCKEVISAEINAATDNPLLFGEDVVLSGGNFHGEAIGMAMDFAGIAMAELASISERRIFRLTDERLNFGLPPMLVDNDEAAGLNSGLMMPQYAAASLVLENRTLASPDSVQSLPTSAEQEDHNANSMTAARHAWQILKNTIHVIAIELYTAARAIDLRMRQEPGIQLGKGTQVLYEQIRQAVEYQPGDALWGPEIEKIHAMIEENQFNL